MKGFISSGDRESKVTAETAGQKNPMNEKALRVRLVAGNFPSRSILSGQSDALNLRRLGILLKWIRLALYYK